MLSMLPFCGCRWFGSNAIDNPICGFAIYTLYTSDETERLIITICPSICANWFIVCHCFTIGAVHCITVDCTICFLSFFKVENRLTRAFHFEQQEQLSVSMGNWLFADCRPPDALHFFLSNENNERSTLQRLLNQQWIFAQPWLWSLLVSLSDDWRWIAGITHNIVIITKYLYGIPIIELTSVSCFESHDGQYPRLIWHDT